MMITKYFDLFAGKSETEQFDVMEQLLKEQGFTEKIVERKNEAKTYWYSKEGVDNVFAVAVDQYGYYLPMIMPKSFAEKYYAKNDEFKRCICVQGHSNKDMALVAKHSSKRLHRLIFKFYDIDIDEKLEVDHISGHQGVIVLSELRLVTSKENKYNKRGRKGNVDSEFAYDALHDFRNSFWIPFLHYVLGVVSAEGMRTLREMELIVA